MILLYPSSPALFVPCFTDCLNYHCQQSLDSLCVSYAAPSPPPPVQGQELSKPHVTKIQVSMQKIIENKSWEAEH